MENKAAYMSKPNSQGMEVFVPTRDMKATPPPVHTHKKKVKLSPEQSIYMAKQKVGNFAMSTVTLTTPMMTPSIVRKERPLLPSMALNAILIVSIR